jgi:hypothetical protein
VYYGIEVVKSDNVAKYRQRVADQLGTAEKKSAKKKAGKSA